MFNFSFNYEKNIIGLFFYFSVICLILCNFLQIIEINLYDLIIIGCLFWPLWSVFGCSLAIIFGYNYVGFFAVSCLFITLLCVFILFFKIIFFKTQIYIILGKSFKIIIISLNVNFYELYWELLFDYITIIILFVIVFISFLVHLYAISYIRVDPYQPRFFASLSLFTFFIIILVTAGNFIQLFVGWEGVGLCSYLLIGFWYTRIQANKSAIQALVINKVGDFILILSIIVIFIAQGTTNFIDSTILIVIIIDLNIGGYFFITIGDFIGFCFFVAAVAKSAQIGLHTWLLSAIEGPTPVSALLHAATIVTAGIFLIIRTSNFWYSTPNIIILITVWGAFTAFFAATCGVVQHDIKKIIAFSTCSQLGYIFYACGLGEYEASLYHLTNHAFFKALLFLGAGAVIHALQGEQDLRRIGGLAQLIPITYISIIIASLSLLGFPFLSGFYSKDILIELAWSHYTIPSTFAFWLATFSAFLTAFYSSRLLYFVFLSKTNAYKIIIKKVIEADNIILLAFRPLILGSIFSGYFFFDIFLGGDYFFKYSRIYLDLCAYKNFNFFLINYHKNLYIANRSFFEFGFFEGEFLPWYIKIIPVIFSFLGVLCAIIFYSNFYNVYLKICKLQMKNNVLKQIHFFFIKKWYFDVIYNYFIASNIYKLGFFLYESGDQGIFEWVGPHGLYEIITQIKFIRKLQAFLHI